MKFFINDAVIVLNDYVQEGILKGECGAIVEVYDYPDEAYEVEFVDKRGQIKALVVLKPYELILYNENK